ncbi:MAG: YhjD/YihY/BrkB family envelope integrity protein [Pseudomonadota bacterium]
MSRSQGTSPSLRPWGYGNLRSWLGARLWQEAAPGASPLAARLGLAVGRTLVAVKQSMLSGERNLQAGLLTYTTISTIVPVLVVAFAAVTAFGGVEEIEKRSLDLVFRYLTPSTAASVAEQLRGLLDRARSTPVSSVGLVFLVLAVVALLGQVEVALNMIWEAPSGRSWGRRFVLYWSVVTATPLLLVMSLGLAAGLPGAARIGPLVLGWIAFAAAYKLMPNRKVGTRFAGLGAIVGGTLFELTARAFAYYTTRIGNYGIYGSLSAIPLFLLWLFAMWHVALAGAEVAFANQHPRRYGRRIAPEAALLEVALLVAIECARRTAVAREPLELDALAAVLLVPEQEVDHAAQLLAQAGILRAVGRYPDRYYLLARSPREITIADVARAAVSQTEKGVPPAIFASVSLAEAAELSR